VTFRVLPARWGISSVGHFCFGSVGRHWITGTKSAEINDVEELLQRGFGIVTKTFHQGIGHFHVLPLPNHLLIPGWLHLQGSACISVELQRSSCLIN
jgi:hypothetical protein